MRKKRARVPLDVRTAIEGAAKQYRLRNEIPNAADIYRMLEKDPKYRGRVPTERTIREYANEEPADRSGPWRATSSAVDASLVLPVLAALIDGTRGRRTQLSVREAEAIEEILEAVPQTPPLFASTLALEYLDAEASNDLRKLIELDAFLAYAPWTSVEAQRRYMNALDEGWVTQAMNWPDAPDATPLSEVQWKTVPRQTEANRARARRRTAKKGGTT